MDDRLAKELRAAIDQHSDSPELRELWLRVLGLQLLAEELSQPANLQPQNLNDPGESAADKNVDTTPDALSRETGEG